MKKEMWVWLGEGRRTLGANRLDFRFRGGGRRKLFFRVGRHLFPATVMSDACCLEELFWTDSLQMTCWLEQSWGRFSAFYSKGVIGPPVSLKLRFPELRPLSLLTWFTSYTFYQRRIAAFLIFSSKTLFQMYKYFIHMMFRGYFWVYDHRNTKVIENLNGTLLSVVGSNWQDRKSGVSEM